MWKNFWVMNLVAVAFLTSCSSEVAKNDDSAQFIEVESAENLQKESMCVGYKTYVAIKPALSIQSQDESDRKNVGFILDSASIQTEGSSVQICQHGGYCYSRSDFHFQGCDSVEEDQNSSENLSLNNSNFSLFEMSKNRKRNESYPEFTISVKTDNVTLNDIILNRSNCEVMYVIQPGVGSSLPLELKFGDQINVRGHCDPSEVTLVSDLGSETFDW